MKPTPKGEVATAILIALGAIALITGATFVFKPSLFPGASRRAATSTETTTELLKAAEKLGATASASVTKIGEANGLAEASPARDFISREIPVALSRLPPPDPKELLEAERRRAAVMEGKLQVATQLYETTMKQSERLKSERDQAVAARRAADIELEKAAAAEHARTMQVWILIGIAVLLLAGWIYVSIFRISPGVIGRAVADMRAGTNPITALDTHLGPRFHHRVRKASQLAAVPVDNSIPPTRVVV